MRLFRTVLIAAMLAILLGTVSIVSVTSFLSTRDACQRAPCKAATLGGPRAHE
jgi:hypothetical protein